MHGHMNITMHGHMNVKFWFYLFIFRTLLMYLLM
jgi:hypothetical protein